MHFGRLSTHCLENKFQNISIGLIEKFCFVTGRGGGGGGGGGGRSSGFGQWDNPGMNHGGRSGPGVNTIEFNVPANKTGLVIGKGEYSAAGANRRWVLVIESVLMEC